MIMLARSVSIVILTLIFSPFTLSHEMDKSVTYRDSILQCKYPASRYERIESSREYHSNYNVRSYNLYRRNVDDADTITVCNGSFAHCAGLPNQTGPYWIDAETQKVMLFSNTTAVVHTQIAGTDKYEAFPACPMTDRLGHFLAAGAECYMLVATDKNKTISFTYWIGPRDKIANEKSRRRALANARAIFESISSRSSE